MRAMAAVLFLVAMHGTQATVAAQATVSLSEYSERRADLVEQSGEDVILVLGDLPPEQDYLPFFPNSNFFYLTGFKEPGGDLLLVSEGDGHAETLFVPPRDISYETWEGLRTGAQRAEERFGLPGRPNDELEEAVGELLDQGHHLAVVGDWDPNAEVRSEHTQRVRNLVDGRDDVEVRDISDDVTHLRRIKSPAEKDLLRKTVEITSKAHRELMRKVEPGMNEFEVQALVEYTFRRYGSYQPAFESIVASGPNSTILHYNENDRFMEAGDVLKVDIGASYRGYAADVTRTVPVDGTFSDEQADLYQLVLDAQIAAEELAEVDVPFRELAQASQVTLAEGLTELGLIEGPAATYECEGPGGQMGECPQLQLYYMHGLGHGIGLDVHDPWPPNLEPGTAFTIEPGVYVRPNLLTEVIPDTPRNQEVIDAIEPAFQTYAGIGIRIEDDYLMTEEGLEWLSTAPREMEEVEELMAEEWDGPEPRNQDWVERYRETGIPPLEPGR